MKYRVNIWLFRAGDEEGYRGDVIDIPEEIGAAHTRNGDLSPVVEGPEPEEVE